LALRYHYSVPRYLLGRLGSWLRPRHFFHRLAPLRLEEVPFQPPSRRWVILKSRLCGICGSDLNLLKAVESYLLEPYASFPCILGHEVVAEVAEAPAGSGFAPGERVAVNPLLPCRARELPPCGACHQGRENLCENFTRGALAPGPLMGFHRQAGGGMAEYLAAPPESLVRLPAELPDEAAVLTDSLASALQPVLDHFPADSHTVVIYGAGIIGQQLLRALRALGSAARVVMVARHPFQGELARAGGAEVVLLAPSRRELGEAVGARFLPTTLGGGNLEGGAHLFFDCVGSRASLQEGVVALQARGTYVLVGTAGRLGPVDLSALWFRELRLCGSAMYGQGISRGHPVRTYELAVELLARPSYPREGLLSHTFPLQDYVRAFQAAFDKRRHRSVKVALDLRSPRDPGENG
jgi:threonine dehydrogenase-like Zn-dependent dehydrogenase